MSEKHRTIQGAALDEMLKRLEGGIKPRQTRQDAPGRDKRPPLGGKHALVMEAATGLPQLFSFEQLLVEVWTRHPKEFGLKTYHTLYPDSRSLANCLYGKRGLIARGHLVVYGTCLYDVAGRAN